MYRINLLLLSTFLLTSCMMTSQKDSTKMVKASKINVQLGIGYYHRGNHELANEKLLKAIRQDPKSSQAYHAYAVLQNRFLNLEKAESYFRKSIKLDSENSEALNNFGAFLCTADKFEEAEEMFMKAVDNISYRSPEIAYTSAAACILQGDTSSGQLTKAEGYLTKALAVSSNFRPALINMAAVTFLNKNNKLTSQYLNRYHATGNATARSLWLEIQNELELDNNAKINELAEKLEKGFANSNEYKQWLALDK